MLVRKLLLALLFFAVIAPSHGQTAAPKARARAANVLSGTIAAIDAAAATVSVQPKSGSAKLYRLTEKTLFWRAKKTAEASDFKTGDAVTVRFRKSTVGPPSLYDLADSASWAWVDRLRHETAPVTVKEIDDQNLHVTEGPSAAEFSYRITDKTQWSKSGKPAAPADFKAGDHAYVVPRLLPGGATMAIAVSDAGSDAAKLKERGKATVSGTLKAVNVTKRSITLHSAAGDNREINLEADCVIRSAGKDVPIAYLRPGLSVTVHLARDESGEQSAKQITIKGRSSKNPSIKAVPKKKSTT